MFSYLSIALPLENLAKCLNPNEEKFTQRRKLQQRSIERPREGLRPQIPFPFPHSVRYTGTEGVEEKEDESKSVMRFWGIGLVDGDILWQEYWAGLQM